MTLSLRSSACCLQMEEAPGHQHELDAEGMQAVQAVSRLVSRAMTAASQVCWRGAAAAAVQLLLCESTCCLLVCGCCTYTCELCTADGTSAQHLPTGPFCAHQQPVMRGVSENKAASSLHLEITAVIHVSCVPCRQYGMLSQRVSRCSAQEHAFVQQAWVNC
jgi:hypothetical protein